MKRFTQKLNYELSYLKEVRAMLDQLSQALNLEEYEVKNNETILHLTNLLL